MTWCVAEKNKHQTQTMPKNTDVEEIEAMKLKLPYFLMRLLSPMIFFFFCHSTSHNLCTQVIYNTNMCQSMTVHSSLNNNLSISSALLALYYLNLPLMIYNIDKLINKTCNNTWVS